MLVVIDPAFCPWGSSSSLYVAPLVRLIVSTNLSTLPNDQVATVVEPCVSVALMPVVPGLPAVMLLNRMLVLPVATNVICAFWPGTVVTVSGVPTVAVYGVGLV